MKENNTAKAIKIILLLFNPIIALIYSFKSLNTKSSYFIIFIFCILYGFAFTPNLDSGLDSSYYFNFFNDYLNKSFLDFKNDFDKFLAYEGDSKDFYLNVITYLTTLYTGNYHFLFASFAFVFSIFYLKSFQFLTFQKSYTNNLFCFFLATIFTLSNSIFNINGVRFWTAAWISIYLILQYTLNRNYYYILFIFLLPFVHGSYWIIVGLVLLSLFMKNSKVLIILFFISFVLSNILLSLVNNISDYLPGTMARYINTYTNYDYVNEVNNNKLNASWFIKPFLLIKNIYPNVLIYCLITIKDKILLSNYKKIFLFTLILAIFVNLTVSVPSVGVRYQMFLYPLITIIWLYFFKYLKKYNWLIYIYPLLFLLDIYQLIVRSYDILDVYFYVSPPLYFLYYII